MYGQTKRLVNGLFCRAVADRLGWIGLLFMLAAGTVRADGVGDNQPENVRRLPKLGVVLPDETAAKLRSGLAELRAAIDRIPTDSSATKELLPDVEIYYKAVHDALDYQEFFQLQDAEAAVQLLHTGLDRAKGLAEGNTPWTTATGLVVRGYISKIDQSVQPYGLVIPASYRGHGERSYRLDLWFHGRGETLSENNFIRDRSTNVGTFAPANTIVLHPYGRYNNAFKFAGEVDVLEALDSVRRQYRIDDDRTSARGFSMGGAAAWQFAVHYSDRWFAANPGAGFAETPEFLRTFQQQTLDPRPFEKQLWHWYDCTDWAVNLKQCPTVAYSGELDSQKQAADIMATALDKQGVTLTHIIGPGTKHSYHPLAHQEVERRMASLAEIGRQRYPRQIDFVTYTLKYNRMHWLTVDAVDEHWRAAKISAEIVQVSNRLQVSTSGVSAFTIDFPSGNSPFAIEREVQIDIDGQSFMAARPESDRSWRLTCVRNGQQWTSGRLPEGLRKRSQLQGPVDDAFMDSFLFVTPTGKPAHPLFARWSAAELERAIEQWRRHFRGNARVKSDQEVSDDDMARSHLVLWGDPGSNAILGKIAGKLPIQWAGDSIVVGEQRFRSDQHGLILIYPNPLQPDRYVVLNSGFTFREFTHLNNARQVAVLPDWAVIDLREPPDTVWPGKVVAADFFDEQWQLRTGR